MRKRLLLLTLLMSFSVPVVAHNEFNGGVGSHPDLKTLQERRKKLINDRYNKAMNALDLKFHDLIEEYGAMGDIKKQTIAINTYETLKNKLTYRHNQKIKRIHDRDGKRIEERDGKKVDAKKVDGKRAKNVKKKIKNAIKNKKANK